MKQVAQDIRTMSDEDLNTYIAAHIANMERSDKELYAQQLEAGYWKKISQPKRPPEVPALVWYTAQRKRIEAAHA